MHITGSVRDADGRALQGAHVVAVGAAHETITQTETAADGRFSLDGGGIVILEATGPDWKGTAAQITSLPRLWRVPGTPRPEKVEVELTLRRGLPVAVRAFAGSQLLGDPTPATAHQVGRVWFRDTANKAAPGDFRWQAGDGNPWIFLPPGQRTLLQVLWTVPGFGSLVCHATHGGAGLLAGSELDGIELDPSGGFELWLNEDLALSACARLESVWAQAEADGYRFDEQAQTDYRTALQRRAALQAISLPARTSSEYLGARQRRAAEADAALSAALWSLERLTIQKSEQDVVRHKNLKRTLDLRLPNGEAAAGAQVRFHQTDHAFRFGVFTNPSTHPITREPLDGVMWKAIKDLGINQIPVSLLWSRMEPEPGERRDAEWDAIYPLAKLHAAGFRLNGHLSVWPWQGKYPDQWNAFVPMWIYNLSPEEFYKAAYEQQKAVVAFNQASIGVFQAINEPMLSHTNAANLTLEQTIELLRWSSKGLRDGGFKGPIEINNCCLFGEGVNADIREQGYERMPCEFFEDCEAAGIDYDVVSLQLGYYGGYMMSRLFQGGFAIRHIADLAEFIDRHSRFGKPVFITEVSFPSSHPPANGPYVGEWHGPWSPERQAEWLKVFYTMCYSKRAVQEITWWNISDENSFIYSGGLMSPDYQPKPAYHMLRNLIHSWMAAGEGQTGSRGRVTFAGPAGTYEVEVTLNGKTYGPYPVTFGWNEGEQATVTLDERSA